MIITNVLILHIPTTILAFLAQSMVHAHTFAHGYNVIEKVCLPSALDETFSLMSMKIQMVGFFCQETILSSIYIAETVILLRTSMQVGERRQRQTMQHLIAINMIIISMDLVLLGVEAASLYILQILLKGLVYSIKLKLEFAILSKLVSIVPRPAGALSFITTTDNMEVSVHDIVDFAKIKTDITHASTTVSNSQKSSTSELEIARFEHDLEKGSPWANTAHPHVPCPEKSLKL
jgi:hypothetical protein